VAEKKTINTTRIFGGESAMVEVIAPVYPFQIRKQTELKEIKYAVALPRLHELVKIQVGKAEAHAEVEKQSGSFVFDEYFVATDFVDSPVEREGGHNNVSCSEDG
jgi:hypothetical protein